MLERNSPVLPLLALLVAGVFAGLLAWDFYQAWRAEQAWLAAHPAPTLDGTIDEEEYDHLYVDAATAMEVYWRILPGTGEIYLAVRCPTQGWVAVGLGGEGPLMKGADIWIAYIDEAGLHVQDNFADEPMTHRPDTALGGTEDLKAAGRLLPDGGQEVEFHRKLITGDGYDQALEPGMGKIRFLLAHAAAKDFTSYHSARNALMLDLFEEGGR